MDLAENKMDGLLSQDQQELSERVAHLEKRVREQEDEIVCLKGALADVMRRLGQVESAKSQNSILPSRPFKTPAPRKHERPKSQLIESSNFTPRSSAPSSARQTPRGASANTIKKWGSTEDTQDKKRERQHSTSSQLSQSNNREPTWDNEERSLRMYLRGRALCLFAPSKFEDYEVKRKQDAPEEKLKLEWVYGYRGRDCRSNLHTVATGEVIFFSAACCILQNIEEQTQRHYLDHTDDIKCLAVHPDQVRVATGQVAGHERKEGKPHVRVWECINLTTLHVIGLGDFQRGVSCVSFAKENKENEELLCAVDESNDHTLKVYNIKGKVKKIAECKASGDPVTQCEFHPKEPNSIVCCGKSQISFWTLEDNKLDKKMGIFQKNEKPKYVICFCFTENGDVVTGDSSGNLYVWECGSNKISKAITEAHEGDAIFSVCCTKEGNILSGGKDRKIIMWNNNFEKCGETEIPEEFGGIRVIQSRGNMLLVGTIRNCLLQGNMEIPFQPFMESHKEEVWGLDTKPGQHQFLTCATDKYIYLWDAQTHTCVWRKQISDPAHCCTIHPTLEVAAIGLQTKKWICIDLLSHEVVAVYNDGNEQHECIQYSPDGKLLACGNRDQYIYIYEVSEDGKKYYKVARLSGHSSYVTHIDWTKDSKYLRSNSGDYECLFWDIEKRKQETQKEAVYDCEWDTQTCTLCFESNGIWPEGADGTDVNSCSASNNGRLLASADDFGKINLYSNPCIQPQAEHHSYGGHSSHVTTAKFLFQDERLITTGGRDCTVMQWTIC